MLKFIVMCILFVMSSLAYFRLHHHVTITSDVIGEAKRKDVAYVKELLLWVMVGSGALVLLCGYDLLYTPVPINFQESRNAPAPPSPTPVCSISRTPTKKMNSFSCLSYSGTYGPVLLLLSSPSCQVALKFPGGTRGIRWDGTFVSCDINSWIKSVAHVSQPWTGWVCYNDETKALGIPQTRKGHCKGIVAWNAERISWLIHSVPNFPRIFTGSEISNIEPGEHIYGQSFAHILTSYSPSPPLDSLPDQPHASPHFYAARCDPRIPEIESYYNDPSL
jgi:hypothetical protein